MLSRLSNNWRILKEDKPGQRFQNRNRRTGEQAARARIVKIVLGVALIVVGVVFLLIPGPGSVLILVGVALLARESSNVARILDTVELWLHNRIRSIRVRLKRPGRQPSKHP